MQIVFDETLYGIVKSGSVYEWRIYVAHNENDTGTIHTVSYTHLRAHETS